MSLDPELAKKVLKVYSTSFKKILNEHSSHGLLGDFDSDVANEIRSNLDRQYSSGDGLKVFYAH